MPSCARQLRISALSMALAIFAFSSTAHATCAAGPFGFLIWPEPNAVDVPTDTPIVVGRYFVDGDTSMIETSVQAADGSVLAVEQTRALPPPFSGCGAAETLFLRPAKPLKPGETYTVVNRAGPKSAPFEQKFTVGDRAAGPQAAVMPSVISLKVYSRAECVREDCAGSSNVLVDVGEPPQQPVWLRLQDSAEVNASNGWIFYPRGYRDVSTDDGLSKIQLGVPVTAANSCIDIELVGIEGQTLFQEQRCQPDRCAVAGLSFLRSGGRPGGAVVDAAAVPEGSCDDPPRIGNSGSIIEPSADAGAEPDDAGTHDDADASTRAARTSARKPVPAANGCSASQPHAATGVGWLATCLGLAAIAFRRRRAAGLRRARKR